MGQEKQKINEQRHKARIYTMLSGDREKQTIQHPERRKVYTQDNCVLSTFTAIPFRRY